MRKGPQGINLQEAIKLAKLYYQEGRRIGAISREALEANHDLIYKCTVGYTNMSFACEIALKVLLIKKGVSFFDLPRSHYFENLFLGLPEDTKQTVASGTVALCSMSLQNREYSISNFYDDLKKYSDAFESSRYWYEFPAEGKTRQAGYLFVSSFAQILLLVIEMMDK